MNSIKSAKKSVQPKILQKYEKLNMHFAKWIVNVFSVHCKIFVYFHLLFRFKKLTLLPISCMCQMPSAICQMKFLFISTIFLGILLSFLRILPFQSNSQQNMMILTPLQEVVSQILLHCLIKFQASWEFYLAYIVVSICECTQNEVTTGYCISSHASVLSYAKGYVFIHT